MMNFRSKIKFDSNSYILDIDLIGKVRKYPLLSLNIKTLLLLAVIVVVLLAVSCSEKDKNDDIQMKYHSPTKTNQL